MYLQSKKVVYDGEVRNSVSGLTNKEVDRRIDIVDEPLTGKGTETDPNLLPSRADVGNAGGNAGVSLLGNLSRDSAAVQELAHQVIYVQIKKLV